MFRHAVSQQTVPQNSIVNQIKICTDFQEQQWLISGKRLEIALVYREWMFNVRSFDQIRTPLVLRDSFLFCVKCLLRESTTFEATWTMLISAWMPQTVHESFLKKGITIDPIQSGGTFPSSHTLENLYVSCFALLYPTSLNKTDRMPSGTANLWLMRSVCAAQISASLSESKDADHGITRSAGVMISIEGAS